MKKIRIKKYKVFKVRALRLVTHFGLGSLKKKIYIICILRHFKLQMPEIWIFDDRFSSHIIRLLK